MNILKKITLLLTAAGIIAVGFGSGYIVKEIQIARIKSPPESADFSLLWEAFHVLEKHFINAGEMDYQKIVWGSIQGMVNSLKDPHTIFFNPEDTKRFLEDADGKFEGVGMEIGLRDGQVKIIAPLKGTPAEKAGFLSGDIIVRIDEMDVSGLFIEEVANLIRGPKGSTVVLTIQRDEEAKEFDLSVERELIHLPSLEWEIVDGFAHIKFYHFYRKANDNFKEIALEVLNSPAKGIVLDLRNNSGGYLEVAEEIGEWFFEKNTLLVVEDYGQRKIERRTKGTGRLSQYPVVVIINQGSASASEILAGALRDNRNSPIVGEKSFGKGSIQRLEHLSDGSSIKITVANWITPSGNLISEKGLVPDFEISSSENGIDYELQKAIEVLKKMI